MAKTTNKISFKNIKIIEEAGNFIIKEKLEDSDVENSENLNEKLKAFINMDGIDISVKKARKSSSNRKPTYKYHCPSCGVEVTSKVEDLEIKCVKCNEDYKIVVKEEK